ncbi:MAG: DUF3108 domain-containing protein [Rikenellaceae bacterium]|nr:DUF3108 domain-containing protein [Rikenellaceae bacterium]
MIRRIGILMCALVAALSASAQNNTPFVSGESLIYAVCYRAKMVPKTPVGRATLKCKELNFEGSPHYRITANGRTLPFFRWFFDLNDTYVSHIEASTMRPSQLEIELREEKYRFDATFLYDWDAKKVYTAYKKGSWSRVHNKTMELSEGHYDPVALFYNLRFIEPKDYRLNEPVDLHMVLEDTIRIITYSYLGEEPLKLKGIGEIPSYKFTCSIATSNGETFTDGTHFFVWLSADDNRIPLLIESPIRVGTVAAYLIEYDNLKSELKTVPK